MKANRVLDFGAGHQITQTLDLSVADEVWAECSRCKLESRHSILARVKHDESFPADLQFPNVREFFDIIQCQGCLVISFRTQSSAEGDSSEPAVTLYPERDRRRSQPRYDIVASLPVELKTVYLESFRARNAGFRLIAAIGLRVILDGICRRKRIPKGLLGKRIQRLVDAGVLTGDHAAILHRVRFLGNQAAHEIKRPDEAELDIACRIIENLLETIFLMPKLARKLKSERNQKKRPSSP